jgi:hypothetical protein
MVAMWNIEVSSIRTTAVVDVGVAGLMPLHRAQQVPLHPHRSIAHPCRAIQIAACIVRCQVVGWWAQDCDSLSTFPQTVHFFLPP